MALSMRVITPVFSLSSDPRPKSSPVSPISGRSRLRRALGASGGTNEEPHFGHAVSPGATSAPHDGHHLASDSDMRWVTSSAAWHRGHVSAESATLAPHLGHVLDKDPPLSRLGQSVKHERKDAATGEIGALHRRVNANDAHELEARTVSAMRGDTCLPG